MFCFIRFIAQSFSDRVVGFLQIKLEAGQEKSKAATISIIKHLINSSGFSFLSFYEIDISECSG